MYLLGVNSVYHESSAALLKDGVLLATAEEERFNRVKHGKQARSDNPHELPMQAIGYVLGHAGITLADVDMATCAADLDEMRRVHEQGLPSAWNDAGDRARFLANVPKIPEVLAEHGFRGDFRWVPHHTAHAASTFLASPYRDAAVLVVDALGDDAWSTRLYHGRDRSLESLLDVRYPASLGYLWETISVLLGFGVYDAAKVMGLAAYGDPAVFRAAFDRLAWPTPDGGFDMDADALRFAEIMYYPPSAYHDRLVELFGIPPRRPGDDIEPVHEHIAAALQAKTNEIMLHLADHLRRRTGSANLCLAGGVALNCVTNTLLLAESGFESVYVQPAANDAGLAVGSALYVWNGELDRPRTAPMTHAYWGPEFSDEEIRAELDRRELSYTVPDDIDATVARLVAEGRVVGYFQGRMELGPRALGCRSIVADPRDRAMREILNQKVKHREYFRPLAPSVLAEDVADWMEVPGDTLAADMMLVTYRAKEDKKPLMGAVLHVDDTCRLQAVSAATNPRYHRMISEFKKITGVPMVLNTSFNDQEPIICTPADAIATFEKTQIDYLAAGSFLVAKV
ncbi:carbamoyltransferase family protein [Micromonospora rifamycinica]|uniref:Carbamoyltransferase n=1 Tax=Micromonospora rifamycinica TaxID=291594 RepID=A0A109IPN0_9ACTN|nr:carbamoyltransferase C-terminal domain-containing protein [Micromonospora rifamycinica]KWV34413.1 hypothetical protein AWV63_01525 [Micromonospora rifamycinica]SCG74076.1 carbamoyltransferase [Micromonospora rifamycinica]